MRDAARGTGVGVLLVEQHVGHALKLADRAYVMRGGEVVLRGTAEHVSEQLPALSDLYLAAPTPGSR